MKKNIVVATATTFLSMGLLVGTTASAQTPPTPAPPAVPPPSVPVGQTPVTTVAQTPTQVTPEPTPEVIALANERAQILTRQALTDYTTANPTLQFAGFTACYSEWETEYKVEELGSRIESTCYSIVLLPDPATGEPVGHAVLNYVETYADQSAYIWAFDIFSFNEALDVAHNIQPVLVDPDNTLTPAN